MMATMEKQPPHGGPHDYNNHPGSVVSGYSGQGISPTHQTVVTMTTDPNPNISRTEINLNIGYFTTTPGWVKIVQLVRSFAGSSATRELYCQLSSYLPCSSPLNTPCLSNCGEATGWIWYPTLSHF